VESVKSVLNLVNIDGRVIVVDWSSIRGSTAESPGGSLSVRINTLELDGVLERGVSKSSVLGSEPPVVVRSALALCDADIEERSSDERFRSLLAVSWELVAEGEGAEEGEV